MKTIGLRIEEERQLQGLSKTDIWQPVGVSSGMYTQWLNGSMPKHETLVAIARVLGVNLEWLATGKGEKTATSPKLKIVAESNLKEPADISIPRYMEVSGAMGTGLLLNDQPGQITSMRVTSEWMNKNLPMHTGRQNLCIVTGFGDSMLGMFNPGDPIIVDTGIKVCDHDGVYFFRIGDEGYIKTLQRIPGQGIRVISENKKYESWTITEDMDFEVFAKVLTVWESKKF